MKNTFPIIPPRSWTSNLLQQLSSHFNSYTKSYKTKLDTHLHTRTCKWSTRLICLQFTLHRGNLRLHFNFPDPWTIIYFKPSKRRLSATHWTWNPCKYSHYIRSCAWTVMWKVRDTKHAIKLFWKLEKILNEKLHVEIKLCENDAYNGKKISRCIISILLYMISLSFLGNSLSQNFD